MRFQRNKKISESYPVKGVLGVTFRISLVLQKEKHLHPV